MGTKQRKQEKENTISFEISVFTKSAKPDIDAKIDLMEDGGTKKIKNILKMKYQEDDIPDKLDIKISGPIISIPELTIEPTGIEEEYPIDLELMQKGNHELHSRIIIKHGIYFNTIKDFSSGILKIRRDKDIRVGLPVEPIVISPRRENNIKIDIAGNQSKAVKNAWIKLIDKNGNTIVTADSNDYSKDRLGNYSAAFILDSDTLDESACEDGLTLKVFIKVQEEIIEKEFPKAVCIRELKKLELKTIELIQQTITEGNTGGLELELVNAGSNLLDLDIRLAVDYQGKKLYDTDLDKISIPPDNNNNLHILNKTYDIELLKNLAPGDYDLLIGFTGDIEIEKLLKLKISHGLDLRFIGAYCSKTGYKPGEKVMVRALFEWEKNILDLKYGAHIELIKDSTVINQRKVVLDLDRKGFETEVGKIRGLLQSSLLIPENTDSGPIEIRITPLVKGRKHSFKAYRQTYFTQIQRDHEIPVQLNVLDYGSIKQVDNDKADGNAAFDKYLFPDEKITRIDAIADHKTVHLENGGYFFLYRNSLITKDSEKRIRKEFEGQILLNWCSSTGLTRNVLYDVRNKLEIIQRSLGGMLRNIIQKNTISKDLSKAFHLKDQYWNEYDPSYHLEGLIKLFRKRMKNAKGHKLKKKYQIMSRSPLYMLKELVSKPLKNTLLSRDYLVFLQDFSGSPYSKNSRILKRFKKALRKADRNKGDQFDGEMTEILEKTPPLLYTGLNSNILSFDHSDTDGAIWDPEKGANTLMFLGLAYQAIQSKIDEILIQFNEGNMDITSALSLLYYSTLLEMHLSLITQHLIKWTENEIASQMVKDQRANDQKKATEILNDFHRQNLFRYIKKFHKTWHFNWVRNVSRTQNFILNYYENVKYRKDYYTFGKELVFALKNKMLMGGSGSRTDIQISVKNTSSSTVPINIELYFPNGSFKLLNNNKNIGPYRYRIQGIKAAPGNSSVTVSTILPIDKCAPHELLKIVAAPIIDEINYYSGIEEIFKGPPCKKPMDNHKIPKEGSNQKVNENDSERKPIEVLLLTTNTLFAQSVLKTGLSDIVRAEDLTLHYISKKSKVKRDQCKKFLESSGFFEFEKTVRKTGFMKLRTRETSIISFSPISDILESLRRGYEEQSLTEILNASKGNLYLSIRLISGLTRYLMDIPKVKKESPNHNKYYPKWITTERSEIKSKEVKIESAGKQDRLDRDFNKKEIRFDMDKWIHRPFKNIDEKWSLMEFLTILADMSDMELTELVLHGIDHLESNNEKILRRNTAWKLFVSICRSLFVEYHFYNLKKGQANAGKMKDHLFIRVGKSPLRTCVNQFITTEIVNDLVKHSTKKAREAFERLLLFNDRYAVQMIIERLYDLPIKIRRLALEYLGRTEDPRTVPALANMLERSIEPEDRTLSLQSLRKIGTEEAHKNIARIVNSDSAVKQIASEMGMDLDFIEKQENPKDVVILE